MAGSKSSVRGQAATEMAVFGSFILVCFAVLLSYAQTFTEQQALQQQAFRMALRKAYDDNGFVSYSILKNHRGPNLFGGFREGERSSISASSSVLWSKGEAESHSYYQINEDLIEIPRFEKDEQETPDEVLDVRTSAQSEYFARDESQEARSKITATRSATLKDTVTTTLKLQEAPDIVIIQGLGPDGRYSQAAAGSAITRTRTWETPHAER